MTSLLCIVSGGESEGLGWAAPSAGSWTFCGSEEQAEVRGASISSVDATHSDAFWLTISSFIQVCRLCDYPVRLRLPL